MSNKLLGQKNALEEELCDILARYNIKYIRKLHKFANSYNNKYKVFQTELLQISKWSENKRQQEIERFILWLKNVKKHVTVNTLNEMLHTLFVLNIHAVVPQLTQKTIASINLPEIKRVFFKCLKSTARFFYENPKLLGNDKERQRVYSDVRDIIKLCLRNFIKLTDLLDLAEQQEQLKKQEFSYSFTIPEVSDNQTNSLQSHEQNKCDLVVEKEESETDLAYMSSNEIYREYYKSDDESDISCEKKQASNFDNTLDNEIKHIHFQRAKRNGVGEYSRFNKANNAQSENFFSD